MNFNGQGWQVTAVATITGGYVSADRMYRRYVIDATCTQGNCQNAPAPIPCRTKFMVCAKHLQ